MKTYFDKIFLLLPYVALYIALANLCIFPLGCFVILKFACTKAKNCNVAFVFYLFAYSLINRDHLTRFHANRYKFSVLKINCFEHI